MTARRNLNYTPYELRHEAQRQREEQEYQNYRLNQLAGELRGLYATQDEFNAAIDAMPDGLPTREFNELLKEAITARRAMIELAAADLSERADPALMEWDGVDLDAAYETLQMDNAYPGAI